MNSQTKRPGNTALTRRDFFRISAITGVGLAISIYAPGCQPIRPPEPVAPTALSPTPEPTAWLKPQYLHHVGQPGHADRHRVPV